jgi:AcrR family transcriptional regulator
MASSAGRVAPSVERAVRGTVGRARPGRVVLMRTAIGLMGKHGYEGTSTRDIAAEAGVSVAALYHHFPSKLDLLREFLFEAHDVVLARLQREIDAAGPDPRDQLDTVVGALIASNLHDEWAQLAAQVAWREHGRLDGPDRRAIAAKRDRMADAIEAVIVRGVESGVFTTTDTHEVARVLLTLCIAVVEPFPDMGMSMADVIELYQRFALALACAPPAHGAR